MNAAPEKRLEAESGIRRALKNGECEAFYQPILNTEDLTLAGIEALIRWRVPGGDLLPPFEFIPLAEDSGLILPIGNWVLREVCEQLAAWRDAGQHQVPIAVNVSAKQLAQGDLLSVVRDCLQRAVHWFREDGNRLGQAVACDGLAMVACDEGLLDEAEGHIQQGIALAEQGHHQRATEAFRQAFVAMLERDRRPAP